MPLGSGGGAPFGACHRLISATPPACMARLLPNRGNLCRVGSETQHRGRPVRRQRLACISHSPSAAAADSACLLRCTTVSLLDIVSTMPSFAKPPFASHSGRSPLPRDKGL